jgi:hypothetical protein
MVDRTSPVAALPPVVRAGWRATRLTNGGRADQLKCNLTNPARARPPHVRGGVQAGPRVRPSHTLHPQPGCWSTPGCWLMAGELRANGCVEQVAKVVKHTCNARLRGPVFRVDVQVRVSGFLKNI